MRISWFSIVDPVVRDVNIHSVLSLNYSYIDCLYNGLTGCSFNPRYYLLFAQQQQLLYTIQTLYGQARFVQPCLFLIHIQYILSSHTISSWGLSVFYYPLFTAQGAVLGRTFFSPFQDTVEMEVVETLALNRHAVISRYFTPWTGRLKSILTYSTTLLILNIPLPSSNRIPRIDLNLHLPSTFQIQYKQQKQTHPKNLAPKLPVAHICDYVGVISGFGSLIRIVYRQMGYEFIQIKIQYRQLMSESAQKYRSNSDMVGDNQTLFDFLKRKKKHNLENTLNNSLYNHSHTKTKIDPDIDEDYPKESSRTKNTYQYQSNKEAPRATIRHSITPKKIDFQDRKQTKIIPKEPTPNKPTVNAQGKSFLSLISPLKNRPNSAFEQNKHQKQNIQTSNKARNKNVDVFCKKKVTSSINSLKEKFNYYNDHIRTLKQKSHGLVALFNPMFNHLTESSNPLTKQVGDMRNKLKAFQSMLNNINTDYDEIVQNFHRNLEEHMKFEEGSIKKSLQYNKNQELQSYRHEKQLKISKLQVENTKLIKQNALLQKKLQKFQRNQQQIEGNVQQRQINYVQSIQRLKQSYQGNIQDLRQQNNDLKTALKELSFELKEKDKEIKNERILRQITENKTRKQIQEIIEVKDAYLLNQIMVLKTEFNADITKISQFSRIKQMQLLDKLTKKEEHLNKIQFQKGCDRHIQSKIIQEANIIKKENIQLKSKADCIITDMYRMNEQLYQHWIALKDIKALSNRLGCFNQYNKIYEDLFFNDSLFH